MVILKISELETCWTMNKLAVLSFWNWSVCIFCHLWVCVPTQTSSHVFAHRKIFRLVGDIFSTLFFLPSLSTRWPFWMIPMGVLYRTQCVCRTALTHVHRQYTTVKNKKQGFKLFSKCLKRAVISAYIFGRPSPGLYKGYVSATFRFLQRSPTNNGKRQKKELKKRHEIGKK